MSRAELRFQVCSWESRAPRNVERETWNVERGTAGRWPISTRSLTRGIKRYHVPEASNRTRVRDPRYVRARVHALERTYVRLSRARSDSPNRFEEELPRGWKNTSVDWHSFSLVSARMVRSWVLLDLVVKSRRLLFKTKSTIHCQNCRSCTFIKSTFNG